MNNLNIKESSSKILCNLLGEILNKKSIEIEFKIDLYREYILRGVRNI